MNILIENQTGLVVHMSPEPYVESDGQWAANKVKTGHSVELSSALETTTEPPYIMYFVYKYEDGNWVVVNQDLYDGQYAHIKELKAKEVVAERNELLQKSDWKVLPDLPKSFTDVWAAYRQQLRDVPQQPGFPWEPLPEPPRESNPRQPSTTLDTV